MADPILSRKRSCPGDAHQDTNSAYICRTVLNASIRKNIEDKVRSVVQEVFANQSPSPADEKIEPETFPYESNDDKEKDNIQISEDQENQITIQKEAIHILVRRVENAEQQREMMKALCSELLDVVSELEERVRDFEAQKMMDDRKIEELEKTTKQLG